MRARFDISNLVSSRIGQPYKRVRHRVKGERSGELGAATRAAEKAWRRWSRCFAAAEQNREYAFGAVAGDRMTALAPRSDFPILEEVCYLNCASIGLESLPVQRAGEELGRAIAGRGTVGFDDQVEKAIFDLPREACARLIGADPLDVALTTHATEALCQVAWWLRPREGENVVSIDLEFPSVTYPWLRVAQETGAEVRLARALDDPSSLTTDTLASVVDDRTTAICVSHVQYATGHRLDGKELADLAHASRGCPDPRCHPVGRRRPARRQPARL